jgi:Na+/melibiose symporter-like transporter
MTDANGAQTTSAQTWRIFFYFSHLTLFVYLVSPSSYLVDFTTTFMLKDHLHATATQVSTLRLITAIPLYLSFIFGFARDLWNPFKLRDRGFFMIFGAATAAVFVWLAVTPLSYSSMLIGMLVVMLLFRFVSAAYQGLLALVGQEKLMSGRLTVIWQIVSSVPAMIGGAVSGPLVERLPPSLIFLLLAVLALALGATGLWKPKAVFNHAYDKPQARGSTFMGDVKRLLKHRPVYPAVLCLFLFQFSPGSNTPLQYYLTDRLHTTDSIYGLYNTFFAGAFIPIFFLYGWLCRKFTLKTLLWVGTLITVPQMMPLAFIHSGNEALMLAVPIGMMGGVAAAAYYDLAIRSCPPGLQGTLMMLADGFFYLSWRVGDWLGSIIYGLSPTYGFMYCALATTAVYALILPVLLLIPDALINTRDGEANPVNEAQVLAEIGEPVPVAE